MDDSAQFFETHRARLIAICYRMLGERSGAEDAVQDTWLRWAQADHAAIKTPEAWLTRVATNIAIDALRSARARRETYVGPWLPEPLVGTEQCPPEDAFILAQECGLALLWAMERLDATERAAFILRDAFDADYSELSVVLGKSETACRQLVSRARKRVQTGGPRFDVSAAQVADLIGRFFAATNAGDFETAKNLLSPTAVAISDGGANARAARRPLIGPEDIMTVITSVQSKILSEPECRVEPALANGLPILMIRFKKRVDSIMTLVPGLDGRIAWIYNLRAPEKLRALR